jgi:hypothetical protein
MWQFASQLAINKNPNRLNKKDISNMRSLSNGLMHLSLLNCMRVINKKVKKE